MQILRFAQDDNPQFLRIVLAKGKKRIPVFFFADGGEGAVAGEHLCVFGEDEQTGVDGVQDLPAVAAGEVGAADAAGKESVSCDEQAGAGGARNGRLGWGEVETDAALGVARGVQDLRGGGVETDLHAVGKAGVGSRGLGSFDAQPAGLGFHHFEQGQVGFVQQNWSPGEAFQLERAADVVDVGVGDEDLFEGQTQLSETAVDAGDFVAGVDDDGLMRRRVTEDGAIALERAYGEGFDVDGGSFGGHGLIVAFRRRLLSLCQ